MADAAAEIARVQQDADTQHRKSGAIHEAQYADLEHASAAEIARRTTRQVWYCGTLQHTATHCNTLQHAATHCSTLQHAVAHCNAQQHTATLCNM